MADRSADQSRRVEPSGERAEGPLFGPNTAAVDAFLGQVRRWNEQDALRFRAVWVARLGGRDAPLVHDVALEHAAVFSRGVRAAVRAGRRSAHTRATFAGRAAVDAATAGISTLIGDLAALLTVYDLIPEADVEFLNQRVARGRRDRRSQPGAQQSSPALACLIRSPSVICLSHPPIWTLYIDTHEYKAYPPV